MDGRRLSEAACLLSKREVARVVAVTAKGVCNGLAPGEQVCITLFATSLDLSNRSRSEMAHRSLSGERVIRANSLRTECLTTREHNACKYG